MSPKGRAQGFLPPRKPGTFAVEVKGTAEFDMKHLKDFFEFFESRTVKWVVYAAGTAAVLDIAHTLFLAARFLFRFDHI
jgi:hypothetical protein